MALIGKITDFHDGKEEWSQYIERLDLYFKANGITSEGKKQATLLTVIGPSSYKLVRNLVAPVKPADMKYADLVEAMNKHHNPIPSEIVQRCKFNSRCRMEEESISEFMASLRSLAEFCNFGSTLDTMLRDRLVCGVHNDRIQRRLLAEKKLDLQTAVEIATCIEIAAINVRDLQAAQSTREIVHRMSPIEPRRERKPKPCFRCGKNNHTPDMCRFKDSTCHFCQKKGHIATVCHSKAPQEAVNAVGVKDPASHAADDRDDEENGTYRLFQFKMDWQQTQSSSSAREPLHQRTNPGRPCSNNHIGNQSSDIASRVNNRQERQEGRYFKKAKDRLFDSEGEEENGHRDKQRNDENRARENLDVDIDIENDDDIQDDDDEPRSSTATAEGPPKLPPPVPSAERPRELGRTSEPREAYLTRDRKLPKR